MNSVISNFHEKEYNASLLCIALNIVKIYSMGLQDHRLIQGKKGIRIITLALRLHPSMVEAMLSLQGRGQPVNLLTNVIAIPKDKLSIFCIAE
jgi:hypothetical protein